MKTKIEKAFAPAEFPEFLRRAAALPGCELKDIQALAAEYGITVSLMGARSFRKGPFADYLEELKAKREQAEAVAEIADNGLGIGKAAAAAFAQKVFDASVSIGADEIGTKKANNISLAISRLNAGDDRARFLEAKLEEMQEKLKLSQFDAAKAAIAHLTELRAIAVDSKLSTEEKLEAARQRLFGFAGDVPTLAEADTRKGGAS